MPLGLSALVLQQHVTHQGRRQYEEPIVKRYIYERFACAACTSDRVSLVFPRLKQ